MSYHDALNYLAQKTSVIELYNQFGGRVAVCPEWNGRIVTSTCEGLEGDSFGFANVQAMDTGRFEDFGGEDQWTISPLIHSFVVEYIKEQKAVLQRTLSMPDANGAPTEFHLSRTISLLNPHNIGTLFDDSVAESLDRDNVSVVCFHTENTVWAREPVWVASRQRGMFNASPHRCIIVSTPPANEFEPDPFPSIIDYLGNSPHSRIRHLEQAMLIRADGQKGCRVTIPFSHSPPIFGAVELRLGSLTLWTFDVPGDSEEDEILIYNSGYAHGSKLDWATYYETNCFSAAQNVQPEQLLTYCQGTLHLNAENKILGEIIREVFGVTLEEITQKMLR